MQEGVRRLRTAGRMIQSATAEMLYAQGFGFRTFRLHDDVLVHRVQTWTTAEARKRDGDTLWRDIRNCLKPFDNPDVINVAVMSFTCFKDGQPRAHTTLGGGSLALFGGGSLFTWPCSTADIPSVLLDTCTLDASGFFEDSAGRAWRLGRRACTATTIGALLQELGHCLSLCHTKADFPAYNGGIMSRGFDYLDRLFVQSLPHEQLPFWDRSSAVRLHYHRFLQAEGPDLARNFVAVRVSGTTVPTPCLNSTSRSIQSPASPNDICKLQPAATNEPKGRIRSKNVHDQNISKIEAEGNGLQIQTVPKKTFHMLDSSSVFDNEAMKRLHPRFESDNNGAIHCLSFFGLGHFGYYRNGDSASHEEFREPFPHDFVLPSMLHLWKRCKATNTDKITMSAIDIEGNISQIIYITKK